MRPAISERRRSFRLQIRSLSVELLERRCLLAALSELTAGQFSQLDIDPREHREGALLVQFRADASAADVAAAEVAGTTLDDGWAIAPGLREVTLAPGTDFLTALQAYKENPDVLFVEPDFRVSLNLMPNDPLFGSLYGLNNTGQSGGSADADTDAPEAWDVTTGSYAVTVAVIDTGVDYSHPDLFRNIWINQEEIPTAIRNNLVDIDGDTLITFADLNNAVNQGAGRITDLNANGRIDGGDLLNNSSGWENGQDNDADGKIDDLIGWNFVTNTNDPRDDHFHGTHVSGTIGAMGNNGVGVTGVNWNVQIMGLKFLDAAGGGFTSDAIDALNFAVANGARISNNSWGGDGFSAAFQTALQNAAAAGHIFVAAAGNNSSNNDFSAFYPANFDVENVVSVAASDRNDQFAWFSNYGASTVDLAAPGLDILSTFPTYMTGEMSSGGFSTNYETISGTSMATPHVAGALALIASIHPEWTIDQIIGQLLNTVDVIPELSQTITGGRLNAAAAVGNVPPDTTAPRVVSSDPTGGVTGAVSQVRLRFSEAIEAGEFDATDVGSFTGPGGPLSVSGVIPVPGSNRQFDVTFATQTAEGDYELVIGPDIHDLAGNAMAAPYTASFSIVGTLVIDSSDVPAPIFDFTAVGSYLTVDQDVSIADLNVRLDITHTYDADLAIYLISPSGNYTFLSYFYGGAGNHFTNTVFDDEAATPIWSGFAPFTGSYQPDTPLATFDGENAAGTWQLWIEDWGFFDEGTLNSWSIEITPSGSSPPPPPPPPPPGNDPPYADYDYFTGVEDEGLPIAASELLANDTDPDGDPLTVVSVQDAYGGSVSLSGDTITFTPEPNFNYYNNGYAGFSYTIDDGHGNSAVGYVTIELTPVNDAPLAVDDSFSTERNQPLTIQPWELEQNDIDPDGDWLTVPAVSSATDGTVAMDEFGAITFTPAPGFLGTAGFDYTLSDGVETATAHVTILVRDVYYFSLTEGGTLTSSDGSSLTFADADIIELTISAGGAYHYAMYFDGSDVGLTTANEDIDAFAILPTGEILISTLGNYSVAGGSQTGNGSNILIFFPSSLGGSTAGDWGLYFQGSSVGLSGAQENIDAIAILSDGSWIVSTTGNVSVPGVSGVDADLLRYDGSWQMYYDGSDVGLTTADEDVDGLYIREDAGGGLPRLYLSTRGNFAAGAVSGENDDVLRFAPTRLGGNTAGSYSLSLDGSAYGLAGFDLDGIHVGPAPNASLISALGFLASASADRSQPSDKTGEPAPLAIGDLLFPLQPNLQAQPDKLAAPNAPRPPASNSLSAPAVDHLLAALMARRVQPGSEPRHQAKEQATDDLPPLELFPDDE